MSDHVFVRTGTAGGTLTILLANITIQSILETVLLATVGAVISFFVSYYLKRLMTKR